MNHLRMLLLAAPLAVLAACQPKSADTTASATAAPAQGAAADTSAVIARVNGEPITRDYYEFYVKGITNGKTSADLTAQQRATALDNLIRVKLVSDEAMKEGLQKSNPTAYLLVLTRDQVLEQAVQEKYLKSRTPTDQDLHAEYDAQIAMMPKTEYHARHILLPTQEAAQQAIARLEKGAKWDDVVKASTDPGSKNQGGDLGWFTPERMMPQFSGALLALKPNEFTHQPIQTQYGWHVIELLGTRELTPPPYDQVKTRLEQMVQAKKFRSYGDDLMKGAKVEKLDPTLAGPTPAAPAAGAEGAAAAAANPTPAPAAPADPAKK
ncbi:MAG TPA: peptidylprolyl isomerase [Steroidobacteraceae bacterium]|jgi:peptidyl-prolyl cis-trans isomerase C|nr:peptidylprolyl isomerase [Steroidobacteraceae bacterium]